MKNKGGVLGGLLIWTMSFLFGFLFLFTGIGAIIGLFIWFVGFIIGLIYMGHSSSNNNNQQQQQTVVVPQQVEKVVEQINIRCLKCDTLNPETSDYCLSCGAKLKKE